MGKCFVLSLKNIGDHLNFSCERVRQIQQEALAKLRKYKADEISTCLANLRSVPSKTLRTKQILSVRFSSFLKSGILSTIFVLNLVFFIKAVDNLQLLLGLATSF